MNNKKDKNKKGLYSFLYPFCAPLVRWLYRIEVIGAENEPDEESGGYVVCSNHLSNRDVVVIAASLSRQVNYFAKAELFKIPLVAQLVRALGAFPVNRGAADVGAMKKAVEIVKDGSVVGIYPQGHRFPGVHPATTRAQSGVGMIVCRGKATVLPVAIETKDFRVRPFRKTIVRIGRPVSYESRGLPEDENGKCTAVFADYKTIADGIFADILSLLPPLLEDETKRR